MKNKFFLYAAVLGLAVTSAATADEGFYTGLIGGANWISRSNSHHSFHGNNQAGYLVGFDVGYTWCNNFSGEFEFVYRHNDLRNCRKRGPKQKGHKHISGDSTCSTASRSSSGSSSSSQSRGTDCTEDKSSSSKSCEVARKGHRGHGHIDGYSVMFNGRYDLCIDMCVTPYVKGGIGWARTKVHASHKGEILEGETELSNAFRHRNSKSGFAWQVGAGIAVPVCDNTILDLGYNFLRAQKEVNNNSFVAALRYVF